MRLEELKSAVRGEVIVSGDAGHEEAARALIWNARKQTRRPGLIVRAASVADVQAAVRFAAANGLRVSPRGGGHNFSGVAVQEGMVLDLAGLEALTIDVAAETAEIGPAVTNGMMIEALEKVGLSFPLGHCASVPMSGYLLGGGLGWNSGSWGFGFSRVSHIDVVLADGRLVRASETENPELFWAARGAGPEFFGVVVGYRLNLVRAPGAITTSVRIYPIARAAELDRWMADVIHALPQNVDATLEMKKVPHPDFDAPVPVVMAIAVAYGADATEADAMQAAIADLAPDGEVQVIGPMPSPISALYQQTGQTMPHGKRYAIDSFWVGDRSARTVAALAEAVAAAPSADSHALITRYPAGRPTLPDAAFAISAPVWASACAIWDAPGADAENMAWVRAASDAVGADAVGHYVGEADLERPGRLEACYAPAALDRLRALRAKYDPRGLFSRKASAAALPRAA